MGQDILGHEWAARLLEQHIAHRQVRHAYLFSGPPGVGRRTLALHFTQALNCTQPPEPGQPCGVCRSCIQTARMQHPDLTLVQAENEGGTLKIEQVRELQHVLSLSPYEATYRVAVLLRFEEANLNAQNALLKTLEEAPARAILLLTASSTDDLLPTITSRCEIFRLRPLPLHRLAEELQRRWNLPANESSLLAHLSSGRVGKALQMQRDPALLEQRQSWLEDLTNLLSSSLRQRFAYAESITREKSRTETVGNLRRLLNTWLSFWRDVLLLAAGSNAPLINLDYQPIIYQVAAHVGLQSARQITAAIEQALYRLDANVNVRMVLETLLMDIPRLEFKPDLDPQIP